MTIEIQLPNGVKITTLQFNLLDTEISNGRRAIIRSIATQHNFLTGVALRKSSEGKTYIELMMKPETNKTNISKLVSELIETLI